MSSQVPSIIALITQERERFVGFCSVLSAEELARPVPESIWRVKDFISHVTTLDAPYRVWLSVLAGGMATESHRGSLDFDVDWYNNAAVALRACRSVDDILQEAARERAALVATLETMDERTLAAPVRFGGDRKRPPRELPLGTLLLGWARHDVLHVADMLKALPERRADLLVTAWLGEAEVAAAVAAYARAMA